MTKEERMYEIFKLLIQNRPHPIRQILDETFEVLHAFESTDVEKQQREAEKQQKEYREFVNGLSTRAQNLLISEQIDSFDKLIQHGEWGLIKIPAMGRRTVNEIKDFLFAFNKIILPKQSSFK